MKIIYFFWFSVYVRAQKSVVQLNKMNIFHEAENCVGTGEGAN
jgi:hypothetical protein